ncbi:MAG: calcium-binding protein [Janthinobacterium lividum]
MATTTWIGGSGDWNTGSNWTGGVPTAADDAVFANSAAPYTVSGGGTAASVTLSDDASASDTLTLAGTYTAASFTGIRAGLHLAVGASLGFGHGALSGGVLDLEPGATLGNGPLALYQAGLAGAFGTLANPIDLLTDLSLHGTDLSGTLAGPISGSGGLVLGDVLDPGVLLGSEGGSLTLAGPANTAAHGILVEGGHLEIATPGAAGAGPILLFGGTLTLDAGVSAGPVLANLAPSAVGGCTVGAASGNQLLFCGFAPMTFANGSGSSEVIGTAGLGRSPDGAFPADFARMSVTGGTGRVTVFAADEGGSIFGGTGGGNLIVAGATITPGDLAFETAAHGTAQAAFNGATLGGGGDGDLLVATGNANNVLAAAAGRETLTGAGATGSNVFFAGPGADLVVAGAGQDLVVGGSGASTLVGGTGAAAFFAGSGSEVILGGAGGDYVQAGSGSATLFTGAGADLIAFIDGQAGGSLVVSGFRTGIDHIAPRGYAAPPTSRVVAGSTVLTFGDGTQATLLGVASLPASAFA